MTLINFCEAILLNKTANKALMKISNMILKVTPKAPRVINKSDLFIKNAKTGARYKTRKRTIDTPEIIK
jgi:hypothetical protein